MLLAPTLLLQVVVHAVLPLAAGLWGSRAKHLTVGHAVLFFVSPRPRRILAQLMSFSPVFSISLSYTQPWRAHQTFMAAARDFNFPPSLLAQVHKCKRFLLLQLMEPRPCQLLEPCSKTVICPSFSGLGSIWCTGCPCTMPPKQGVVGTAMLIGKGSSSQQKIHVSSTNSFYTFVNTFVIVGESQKNQYQWSISRFT